MKRIVMVLVAGALVLLVLWGASQGEPLDLTKLKLAESTSAVSEQASAALPANHGGRDRNDDTRSSPAHAVPSVAAPANAEALTAVEERVVAMYEEIASGLSVPEQACEAMGEALAASVHKYAADVNGWAQTQVGIDEQEQVRSQKRLTKFAGKRLEAAQDAIRGAMASCMTNPRFQEGLGDLAALGAVHETP